MTASNSTGHDGIFISYRSGNSSFAADRLNGRLAHPFGSKRVSYAPDGVRLAQNLVDLISDSLRSGRVLLVKPRGLSDGQRL
jgi:hypothetical protein